MSRRIDRVQTFVVDAFRANFVFVKLITDDGLTGVGEGTVEHRELTLAAAIEEIGRYLTGKDPFAIEHHVEMLNRDSYWRTGVILRSALSAVEMALHDIKGKALGVPVYELLGGKQRDRIRCYANGWFVGAKAPDEFAAKAKNALALGFRGLKWDPFGQSYLSIDGPTRARAIECVEAVRGAVGPAVDLMIEGHGRFDVPTAIAIARDLAPFRPTWFEEPIPPENIDALAEVRRKSPVPIATGERYYEPARFQDLIAKRAADFLQPDVCHVGGLSEARKIAALAHMNYLPIAPHNPLGPVGNAATLQLAAASANFAWLETMMTDVPWRSEIVREDVSLIDGEMTIPAVPGLGVELDEAACAAHPYQVYELRHYRGTLTNIRPQAATPFFKIVRSGDRPG